MLRLRLLFKLGFIHHNTYINLLFKTESWLLECLAEKCIIVFIKTTRKYSSNDYGKHHFDGYVTVNYSNVYDIHTTF